MLKWFFLLIFFPFSLHVFGGGMRWPGVPYTGVRGYIYNLHGMLHGHHSPVKDGQLDTSVVLPGIELKGNNLMRYQKWLVQDLSLLQEGLSKCYIPHHAVVFFDADQKPVAWMSACLLCTGVQFYHPKRPLGKVVYNEKSEKKAIAQADTLAAIFRAVGLPVLGSMEDYARLGNQMKKADNPIVVTITNDSIIKTLLPEEILASTYSKYLKNCQPFEKHDMKVTLGGDKYYFTHVTACKSKLVFSGRDRNHLALERAEILDKDVNLLIKLFVGSSLEDVLSMMVYDGPESPDQIILQTSDLRKTISLHFEKKMIKRIEMVIQ
jgi:hypothetical protein